MEFNETLLNNLVSLKVIKTNLSNFLIEYLVPKINKVINITVNN